MATFTERNQNLTQVITVLCDAGAVARGCGGCATVLNGVAYADLLAQLQVGWPTVGWDSVRLDETVAYARARGILSLRDSLYYLNYTMQRLGGANLHWARLCPGVEQPSECIGMQAGKYVTSTPYPRIIEDPCAALANPANGCCPPLTP